MGGRVGLIALVLLMGTVGQALAQGGGSDTPATMRSDLVTTILTALVTGGGFAAAFRWWTGRKEAEDKDERTARAARDERANAATQELIASLKGQLEDVRRENREQVEQMRADVREQVERLVAGFVETRAHYAEEVAGWKQEAVARESRNQTLWEANAEIRREGAAIGQAAAVASTSLAEATALIADLTRQLAAAEADMKSRTAA